jgi:hypothetical protein
VEPERGVSAQITASEVSPAPHREVALSVHIAPSGATKDANWVQAIAWQGGGFVQDRLAQVGEGVYRTTKPLPAYGDWKTIVRLHRDDSLLSAPVYMPRDPGIPAAGIPLRADVTRPFIEDHELLQRERKDDVPGWLPAAAYGVVGMIVLGFLGILGWALARLPREFAADGSRAGEAIDDRDEGPSEAPSSRLRLPKDLREERIRARKAPV